MSDKPWTRRDDETDAAWQAFRIYRDLGLSRTVEEAWRRYADERDLTSKRAPNHFHEWKEQHDWYDRVGKYDEWMDERRRSKVEEAQSQAIAVLADQAVPAAAIVALLASGADPESLDIPEIPDADLEDVDGHQKWAIQEVLSRVGVTSPDQVEFYGEVIKEHEFDLEEFAEFFQMDDDEERDRIEDLDEMRDELEVIDVEPTGTDDD